MFLKHAARLLHTVIAVLVLSTTPLHAQARLDTIRERIENRDFPSVFSPWHIPDNRTELGLSDDEARGLSDLHIVVRVWPFNWYHTNEALHQEGNLEEARRTVEHWRRFNPNQILIVQVRMRSGYYPPTTIPPFHWTGPDFPYWIRGANGAPLPGWPGTYLLDFTHPDMQDRIVQQVIEAAETGLYDGVFFDYWSENWSVLQFHRTIEQEREARGNILRRIREAVHPDFLILVNMNHRRDTMYPHLINGSYMETYSDQLDRKHYSFGRLLMTERSLAWLDENLREPRYNVLEGVTLASEYDTPTAKRMMRFFTTMCLTHSNASVLYSHSNRRHDWHSFWDASLGKPKSPKSQQVEGQGRLGCFIREFENGWAVYNRSRKTQVITLPEVTVAFSTGKYDYIHEVPSMDGEIFIRSHPSGVDKRNLLTTSWGALKMKRTQ